MKFKFKLTNLFSIVLFLAIFLSLVFFDQLSKWICHFTLEKGVPVKVIDNFFYITLAYNKGAAFSSFAGFTPILAVLSLGVSVFLIILLLQQDFKKNKFLFITYCLILAGCFGNMIDRFLTVFNVVEGVVDFFDFVFFSKHFATFNLADAYLTIGIVLLAVEFLILEPLRNRIIRKKEEATLIDELDKDGKKDNM